MKKYTFIAFFFIVFIINAQTKVSVEQFIKQTINSKITDSLKIALLTNFAGEKRYTKNTLKLIRIADEITQKNQNVISRILVLRGYGNYYYYNSKIDSAEYFLKQAIHILPKENYFFIKSSIHTSLSAIYRKKGNIQIAIKYLLQAKLYLAKLENQKLTEKDTKKLYHEQLVLYNSLANFYSQMNDYNKSIAYYDLAYKKAIATGYKQGAGVILSNKGDLLLKTGKNEEALQILTKALQLKKAANTPDFSIANTNQNIALALYKLKKYNEALQQINQVIKINKLQSSTKSLADSYIIRGDIYRQLNQNENAIKDCEKVKKLSKDNVEILIKMSLCLSKAYEATGNYKEALANYKIYKKAKDKFFNKKNIKKITQLEMQSEFDKEKEVQKLIAQSKEQKNKTTVQFLILGLLSLLLISGLLYRLNYIRKKNNLALQEKNKTISEALSINEVLMKETHHRVKNNLQIISSLLNMQSKFLVDKKSKEVVADSQNRIKSMSLIHQQLYQGTNLTGIKTASFFSKLIESLALSYGIDLKKVKMNVNIENLLLDIDTAIPLGLVLNELISNAFKHGVDKEKGSFSFTFKQKNTDALWVKINDNGGGIPDNFDIQQTASYGMKLVQILSKKLKANISFQNKNGLEVNMLIHNFKIVTEL